MKGITMAKVKGKKWVAKKSRCLLCEKVLRTQEGMRGHVMRVHKKKAVIRENYDLVRHGGRRKGSHLSGNPPEEKRGAGKRFNLRGVKGGYVEFVVRVPVVLPELAEVVMGGFKESEV